MIEIVHENGYKGRLYGKSSMVVIRPDGSEAMHTGFRVIDTEKELYDMLENYPLQEKLLSNIFADDEDDNLDI